MEKAHGHDHGGAAFQKMQYVLRDVYVARVVMFLQRRATGSLVCCSNMFKMSFLILKVWVTLTRPASASQINARCLGDADGSWAPPKDEGLQGHIETYTGSPCLFIYAILSTWTILTICAMSLSQ